MLRQNMSDKSNHFRLTRFSIETKRNEKEKIQILRIKYDLFKQTRAINKPIETVSTCIYIYSHGYHSLSIFSLVPSISITHSLYLCSNGNEVKKFLNNV